MSKPAPLPPGPNAPGRPSAPPRAGDVILAQQRMSMLRAGFLLFGAVLP